MGYSGDVGFIAFTVRNKSLFQRLISLGIKIEGTKENEFSHRMRVVLPSGESVEFIWIECWTLPYVDGCSSISTWIVELLFREIEDVYPAKEEDEYSDFSRELIALFNEAGITHLDWQEVNHWSRNKLEGDLSAIFDEMDGDIEEASIEHTYGLQGDVGPCIYTEVNNGKRFSVNYFNTEAIETEKCDGLKFVVAGKFKHFENREKIVETIEGMGGSVLNSISKNTDYLICNDIHSASSKMKKAKELGIAVLTEMAFIRRFCDTDLFDGIGDNEEIGESAWPLTYEGKVMDFVTENGTQPIVMEVWKDGKWQANVSDQKTAALIAAESADRDEARALAASLFEMDSSGTLKNLLLNKKRDCLKTSKDPNSIVAPFEDLCTRGSVRFEWGPIDTMEEKDCILVVQKKVSKLFRDPRVLLSFTIICKHSICDLSDCKNRALEISSAIIDLINGKDLPGYGKVAYTNCFSLDETDEYAGYRLSFLVQNDLLMNPRYDVNIIKGYEKDNACIVNALRTNPRFKLLIGNDNDTADDTYVGDCFRTSYFFLNGNTKIPACRIVLKWNFLMNTVIKVLPVSRDRKQLADLSALIKKELSGLDLPVRGPLIFREDNSKEEIELSDNLYGSVLLFT